MNLENSDRNIAAIVPHICLNLYEFRWKLPPGKSSELVPTTNLVFLHTQAKRKEAGGDEMFRY